MRRAAVVGADALTDTPLSNTERKLFRGHQTGRCQCRQRDAKEPVLWPEAEMPDQPEHFRSLGLTGRCWPRRFSTLLTQLQRSMLLAQLNQQRGPYSTRERGLFLRRYIEHPSPGRHSVELLPLVRPAWRQGCDVPVDVRVTLMTAQRHEINTLSRERGL